MCVFAQRFTPGFALAPFMGWLFRVRDVQGNLQQPRVVSAPKPAKDRAGAEPKSGDGPSLAA